jgi:DNA-binding transcriptional ArsR family regulator
MPTPDRADLHRAARIFQGLAHPHRIQIACVLGSGRATTQKDLIEELGWPQSTVARHLAELRDRGLIRGTRHGNQVYLELAGTVTPKLLAVVCDWVHPETHEAFAAALTAAGESA